MVRSAVYWEYIYKVLPASRYALVLSGEKAARVTLARLNVCPEPLVESKTTTLLFVVSEKTIFALFGDTAKTTPFKLVNVNRAVLVLVCSVNSPWSVPIYMNWPSVVPTYELICGCLELMVGMVM